MTHTIDTWRKHPGRNPLHRFGEGRKSWGQKVTDPRTGLEHEITVRGPKNPNRWLPHQGRREIERRLRQASKKS